MNGSLNRVGDCGLYEAWLVSSRHLISLSRGMGGKMVQGGLGREGASLALCHSRGARWSGCGGGGVLPKHAAGCAVTWIRLWITTEGETLESG